MKYIIFAWLFLICGACFAGWTLCNQASALNFLTTVNNDLTEVHSFANMAGTIGDDGIAMLKVDLASVETHNPLRNERIRKFIFNIESFQELAISIQLKPEQMEVLTAERPSILSVKTTVSLHGIRREISADLLVTRLQTGCLLISSLHPIILSLADFGLTENLEKLRTLAKLDSISNTVSVTFNLFFRKDGN